ncbi:MAG: GIY-YIG nuclease family protein [Myxococcales bacterium]|nr:GIY-YIG nuclease family protein [Myxococcales bacterium]
MAARRSRGEPWFVYLLACGDGSLYTGIARDVAARLAQHAAGKGAKYTRGRGPLELLVKRRCPSKGDALRLELAVKRLSREAKLSWARAGGRATFPVDAKPRPLAPPSARRARPRRRV